MVMSLAASFIQSAQNRIMNSPEPTFGQQDFKIPVDSGLIQGFHYFPTKFQDFLGPQGPILPPENYLHLALLKPTFPVKNSQ
jgi:hypothetical protein